MQPKKKPTKGNPKKGRQKGQKKEKKHTVKVFLPAIIPGQSTKDEEPPSEYELDYKDAMLAVKMEKLAAKGLTNDQIIDALGISRFTFYKRLKEEPYFSYCLYKHQGKAVADVESALYQNAVGFDYFEQAATPSGKVVNLMKHRLPETKAQQFFLTNRKPTEWKNKVEATHELGAGLAAITFSIKRYEE